MSWRLSNFKTSLDTSDCSDTVSTLTFCQRFIIAVLKMSLLKTFISVIVIENTSITSFKTPTVLEQSFKKISVMLFVTHPTRLTVTDTCKNITISI